MRAERRQRIALAHGDAGRMASPSLRLNSFDSIVSTAATFAALSYIYFDLFAGVTRYLLPMAGLALLNYIPAALAAPAVLLSLLSRAVVGPRSTKAQVTLIFLTVLVVVALLQGRIPQEIALAFYVSLPLLLGVVIGDRQMEDVIYRHLAVAFWVASAGVIFNTFIQFPWSGATYEVLGQEVVASRAWESQGVQRLAGFSRASYAAAAQIVLGFICYQRRLRRSIVGVLSLLLACVAVYLTNSKSPLASLGVVIGVYIVLWLTSRAPRLRALGLSTILVVAVLCVFAMPFFAVENRLALYPKGEGLGLEYSSLGDRVVNTWPQALALIDWRDQAQVLLGRGLGGIGVPQSIRETPYMNPADNFGIYLFVTFGICYVIFIIMILYGGAKAIRLSGKRHVPYVLIVATLVIGTMANVVEGALTALVLGITCASFQRRSKA